MDMVDKYPQNICMNSYSQDTSMTYEKAFEVSLSLATGLIKELKLKPKDRIGVYSYNKW
jgi:acyl-CoA synthetase (AMP-forming)/AMP-acid ligase II